MTQQQQDAMNANKLALEYLKMAKLYGPAIAYANTTIDDAIRGIAAVIAQPVQPAAALPLSKTNNISDER